MARPTKPIDQEQLEKLAEKQWSIEQIAAFFRVSRDTIERRYAAKIAEAKQRGGAKLLDLAWKRVIEGSDRMLIHMLKQYLGHKEKVELDVSRLPDEALAEEARRRLNGSKE